MFKSNKTFLAGIVSTLFITTAANAIELTGDTDYSAEKIHNLLSSSDKTINGNNYNLNITRDQNSTIVNNLIINSTDDIKIDNVKNFILKDTLSNEDNNYLIQAENTHTITINSNDTFKIESDHYVPLHANGGNINIQTANKIDIVAHKDNAIFVQNRNTNNASLTIGNKDSSPDIDITGEYAINVGSFSVARH